MAGRPKSPYRAETDKGRRFGIVATDDDRTRIAHLARWYCLSADHLARYELADERLWNPYLNGLPPGQRTTEYEKKIRAIKERLGKLVRVQENPGNHTGPLVGSALVDDGKVAWFATRYGITVAALPWRFRSTINPQFAAHAMMAADIGMQVESLGFRVYSERELASGTDKNGDEITTPIESHYTNSSGVRTAKKPDVAIISQDMRSFHAIEVERDQNRSLSTYAEKLRAYDDNPALTGVWYLCAYEATANRIKTAATRVFGDRPFNLRVRVVGERDGWHGVPDLRNDERLVEDLRRLT